MSIAEVGSGMDKDIDRGMGMGMDINMSMDWADIGQAAVEVLFLSGY